MDTENKNNRLIKGLWSLTSLRSSEFIKLVKSFYPELTGSRLRGLLSSKKNSNYRVATEADVCQCINTILYWFEIDDQFLEEITDQQIELLLKCIDQIFTELSIDTPSENKKESLKNTLVKFFLI